MPRPAMPALARGDELMMYSGTPGRRDGKSWSRVRVVTVGRKYVHVISADKYADPLPDASRYWLRKFLLSDCVEGEPGKRVGYSASIATREQVEFDARVATAGRTVRDVAGLDTRYGSPFDQREHPDRLLALAEVLAELLPALGVLDDAE